MIQEWFIWFKISNRTDSFHLNTKLVWCWSSIESIHLFYYKIYATFIQTHFYFAFAVWHNRTLVHDKMKWTHFFHKLWDCKSSVNCAILPACFYCQVYNAICVQTKQVQTVNCLFVSFFCCVFTAG